MLKTEVLLLGQKQATVKWGPGAALSTSGGRPLHSTCASTREPLPARKGLLETSGSARLVRCARRGMTLPVIKQLWGEAVGFHIRAQKQEGFCRRGLKRGPPSPVYSPTVTSASRESCMSTCWWFLSLPAVHALAYFLVRPNNKSL